jgi:hypothetical protein
MSTPAEVDLVREVAALRRDVGRLLKTLHRPVADGDLTIAEFCVKHRISKAGFYKLRAAGRGPDVLENGGLRRITREADRAWELRWGGSTTMNAESGGGL